MHLQWSPKRTVRTVLLACATLGSAACAAILGVDDRTLDEASDGTDASVSEPDAGADAARPAPPAQDAGDASPAPDRDADAARPTVSCQGAPASTCAGCSAGTAACRGTCVSDCSNACDPATLGCFACPGGVATGTCEPLSADASCIANPAYVHCACTTDAGVCPGANQVCVMNECRTCGEPATVGEVCRDGTGMKRCKSATDPDETKRLRCK